MKQVLAVAFLLVAFASAALADGAGLPPRKPVKPPQAGVVQLADGAGLPPVVTTKPAKPPASGVAA